MAQTLEERKKELAKLDAQLDLAIKDVALIKAMGKNLATLKAMGKKASAELAKIKD